MLISVVFSHFSVNNDGDGVDVWLSVVNNEVGCLPGPPPCCATEGLGIPYLLTYLLTHRSDYYTTVFYVYSRLFY